MWTRPHGVGIRGPKGLGVAEEQHALDGIDLLIGTCGKAYGGMGASIYKAQSIRLMRLPALQYPILWVSRIILSV